jgi:hypothetical protein
MGILQNKNISTLNTNEKYATHWHECPLVLSINKENALVQDERPQIQT